MDSEQPAWERPDLDRVAQHPPAEIRDADPALVASATDLCCIGVLSSACSLPSALSDPRTCGLCSSITDRSDSSFAFSSVSVSGPSSAPTSNRFSTFQLITLN